MIIKCISNTGKDLIPYGLKGLKENQFGRFGASSQTQFGLAIDKEYLVMGILLGNGAMSFLIDDAGYISTYPYPLFNVIQNSIPQKWFFRSFKNTDLFYPYREAVWGYKEFVFDKLHYKKLIDGDEEAQRIYFRRKIEFEKMLGFN